MGHAGGERGVNAGERAMGTAADGVVADTDGEREGVGREGDSMIYILIVTLGSRSRRG